MVNFGSHASGECCLLPTYLVLRTDLHLQVQIYYRFLDLVVVAVLTSGAHPATGSTCVVRRVDLVRLSGAASALARSSIGTTPV